MAAKALSASIEHGWREGIRRMNGIELHVVEAGDPSHPLLLLLHGFPEFWWAWRHQITPLAEAGFHVVAPDMRGYNTSSRPQDIAAYTIDILAADIIGLADFYAADRFYLVGHDWGAVVAWQIAAHCPCRLQRVVVMDGPNPDVWLAQALKHPSQAFRSTYVAAFQLPWLPETTLEALDFAGLKTLMQSTARENAFEPGALDSYAVAWGHPGTLTAMLNYYRALRYSKRPDNPIRISVPLLALWGEADSFLERHVMEAGIMLCNAGRLVEVAEATHWLHLEQPDRINREIVEFFTSGTQARGLYSIQRVG